MNDDDYYKVLQTVINNPGFKAKAIARIIGLSRKQVYEYLNGELKECVVCDDKTRWYLKKDQIIHRDCSLPQNSIGESVDVINDPRSADQADDSFSVHRIFKNNGFEQKLLDDLDPVNLFMNKLTDYPLIDHNEEIKLAKIIESGKSVAIFKSDYYMANKREATGKEVMLWLIDSILDNENIIRAFAIESGLSKNMTLAQILTSYPFQVAIEGPFKKSHLLNVAEALSISNVEELFKSVFQYIKPLPVHEIDKIAATETRRELRDLRQDPIFIETMERDNKALEAHFKQVVDRHHEAHNKFTQSNLRLVVHVAINYVGQGLSLLDLIQEGSIGLGRAIDRYDYRLGNKFSTYAVWWIRQSITRSISDKANTVRIPVHMIETLKKVTTVIKQFEENYLRKPTPEEIEEMTGFSQDRVLRIIQLLCKPVSWEEIINEREEGYFPELIDNDNVESMSGMINLQILRDKIDKVLSSLTSRERKVLLLRYGLRSNLSNTYKTKTTDID
ncbi:MAG: RNA polymerase sigma factor SigA [Firmicutes bacterium ADurb.Bin080]|nr:MAG: RNA polymerase sigma factor SigA [Firmicutes bacterium ADurb.Bin080]